MISEKHRKVLRVIHERLRDFGPPWAITGSLGFALHGMDVPVNDIDLQTDKLGAYQIQDRFPSEVCRNVGFSEAETIRSFLGELRIHGTKVEIMGALQKKLPSGRWEPPVDVEKHRVFVQFDGLKVPVLSLKYEETAYRKLGRTENADAIKRWLTSRSSGRRP
ncbi:MAG: hypothetical protein ABSH14_09315 [Verrucomicrobiia bacterium]|jgi:hypothetical protein